jgi:hypothetical protein
MGEEQSALVTVLAHVPIDRLVTDRKRPVQAQTSGDLLGTPIPLEQLLDAAPLARPKTDCSYATWSGARWFAPPRCWVDRRRRNARSCVAAPYRSCCDVAGGCARCPLGRCLAYVIYLSSEVSWWYLMAFPSSWRNRESRSIPDHLPRGARVLRLVCESTAPNDAFEPTPNRSAAFGVRPHRGAAQRGR